MITVGESFISDAYEVINPVTGDPETGTTVTVTIHLPDGTQDSAVVDEPAPGVYTFTYLTAVAGAHRFSVRATLGFLGSTVVALDDDVFNVDDSSTAAALVGLREAKEHLGIERDDTDVDERLRRTIVAASELVEKESRLWHRATVVEEMSPSRSLVLSQLPVVSITSITQAGAEPVDVTGLEADAYGIVQPLYGVWPWSGWPNTNKLTVTYEAGTAVVPAAVRQVVLDTVEHLWSANRGPASLPLQSGGEEELEDSAGYALPPGAYKMLEPWRPASAIA